MIGNSFNLVAMIREHLSGDTITRTASAIGESSDRTRAGVNAAIPGLLAGLDRAASTPDGVRRINSAIDDSDDSVPGSLGISGFSSDSGSGILRSILGGGALSELTSSIGRTAGLSGKAAYSIIGLLAPLVFGVLKNVKQTIGSDRFDVASLLASQRDNIAAAMPEGMVEETYIDRGVASRERLGETYREERTIRTESRRHGWLLPLALLIGAIGLLWLWSSRRETGLLPPSTVQAGREPDATRSTTLPSFDRLKTKYDSVINEAQAQGVQISELRQDDDKLVIKGTAPSLEAANNVWNEIKRVNPAVDDIKADFQVESTPASETQPAAPDQSSTESNTVGAADSTTQASEGSENQMYTVQPGDSLTSISRHFYGNVKDYTRILNANREKIQNEDVVSVGQVLLIPKEK